MELRAKPMDLLQKIDKEIHQVGKKITTTITSDNFSYAEIDEWINVLNHLIRELDHTVEQLLSLKSGHAQ